MKKMAKQKEIKTNAMRMLDRAKVSYTYEEYECDDFTDGIQTADKLGYDHKLVYKTLVTTGKTGNHYVFVIPIEAEIDFKKAAKVVGEKSLEMLHLKDLTSNPATQSPILHTSGELRQKLFKICTAMSAENDVCRSGRYIMLKSYLMQMLILLLREQGEPVKINTGCSFESTSKKYVVDQIVNYFEDHYSEKISLDQIAENMYLSPFYISRIFKSETGDTPIRHLINIRLEKAKELLENGFDGSIQEVAAEVGYDDVYHFSKLFKKRFGMPPSKIRKLL